MLSKKTAIGIGIGSFLIIWGTIFLIPSFGKQTQSIDETIGKGGNTVYQFDAKEQFHEILNVTGSSFHVKIRTPADGLQLDEAFKSEANLDWYGVQDGQHRIEVTNTGDSDLQVTGTLEFISNPIEFAKHMLPIISGIVIIGISAVFTVRRPRGF
jgi:hypothetical protein